MPDYVNKPTPPDFLIALGKNWASLISGGLSVPFTIISIFTSGNTRIIFACLAAAGFLFTSYSLWAQERSERVKLQDELDDTIAKLGRPEVTVILHNNDTTMGRLWVCCANYSESAALNVGADEIVCGSKVLRLEPIPPRISASFSPDVEVFCTNPDKSSVASDIASACAFNRQSSGADRSDSMLLAIRYTDADGKYEWVTFGRFFYDFVKKKFVLEKQWIERTKTNQTAILTV